MTLVSVIIPAYNAEKTIKETIQSVLNQTLTDFEIIIINDGSQDGTLDVISRISDPRIKIFSYPNSGGQVSRNRGMKQATGEYLAFLDADDLWTPDKLDAQFKALQQNPQAAVAYSWTNRINESSQFLRRGSYLTFNGDVYKQLLVINFLENGSNPLIRKYAIAAVGGFDESLSGCQDWDMWLRLAAHYPFVAVPSPQILYRESTNSVSSSNLLNLEVNCLRVIERNFSQAPEVLQTLRKKSISNIYKYLIFKTFEGAYSYQKGWQSLVFLFKLIKNEPSFCQNKIIIKLLLKATVIILLPSHQSRRLTSKFQRTFNTSTLLGYLETTPSL